ncbi:MAG TPA: hypothetical protein DCF33_03560 [Saprospirales bacterium]|nr:hypothetical protein [Saprospirales bacterium]
MLLFSFPFTAEASVAAPIAQGETVVYQPVTPHAFVPKKQRFINRIAENILQKRLKKAFGRDNGALAKPLAVSGFLSGLIAVILFLVFLFSGSAGILISSLILSLIGLVLSMLGLNLRGPSSEKLVKGLSIAGIALSSSVLLVFLLEFILLLAAFS